MQYLCMFDLPKSPRSINDKLNLHVGSQPTGKLKNISTHMLSIKEPSSREKINEQNSSL
jgi:hypothetical protein